MKHFNLIKTFLLLFALVVGGGSSAWADKVTDYNNIVSGKKYYIGATTGGNDYYLSVNGSSTTNSIAGTAVSDKASAAVFTFNGSGTSWTIQFESGNYLSLKEGKDNGKVQVVSSASTFTASNGSGKIRLSKGNYSIQKNNSGTQFGSYANTQTDIWLEEATAASPLVSIALSGSYPTSFYVGDAFSHEGMVVTATYDDASTKDVTENATFSTPDMTTTGSKTVTVTYTESEIQKTASYDIVVKPLPTLESLSLSGTYPTTFNQYAAFSSEGIVVTAHYDDESTKDVTEDATFTGYDMSTPGLQTVTVGYSGKTTTYEITVNEYVQPTSFDINLNNTLFDTNYSGTASGITDDTPLSGVLNNVTVTYAGSGNHYVNNSQIRFYPNNKLKFEAPTGYVITKIAFTSGGTWAATISANEGTYTSSTKTWTGEETSVLFTGSGSSRCDMSKVAIILEKNESKTLSSIALSGTYKTEFYVGDDFSHTGMVVTATYDNASTKDVTESALFEGYDMSSAGTQEITVSYTENGVTKTTTYNILVKPLPVLESISLSGSYPTTFIVGDDFSHTGMVVTAKLDDKTETDVTSSVTFDGYDMDIVGTQTVTVSYTLRGVEKTATYEITVNPIPNKTIADFITAGGGKCYLIGTVSNIVNSTYGNYTLTDTSGSIYVYGTLTQSGESKKFSTLGISEGDIIKVIASSYTLYSGNTDEAVNVVFVETFDKNATIEISSAGYATYCSNYPLDFTGITTLTAYTASVEDNTIRFNKVEGKVPANTGLLVSGETTNVPVCASADPVDNLLVGVTTETVKDANTIFVLMNGSKGIGFYKNSNAFTLRANSAYLPAEAVETAGARAFIGFDDETTGIAEMNTQKEDAKRMFDLQGRKVTKTAKGLYIVDGRKVVVK